MKWIRFGDKGLEVERWQNFLYGFFPNSRSKLIADGEFGPTTLEFTKKFQSHVSVIPDGVVGNQTLGIAARFGFPLIGSDDEEETGPSWPKCPEDVKPLTESQREDIFGKFSYKPEPSQANQEGIRIIDGWDNDNIIKVKIPQLSRVANSPFEGNVRIHIKLEKQFVELWKFWEDNKLLSHAKTWNGSYVPRFIRGSRTKLSNHSWGTAFDINVSWNGLGVQPALKGFTGSVRELVQSANEHGFYWGGHFKNRPDGMHFEAYKVL